MGYVLYSFESLVPFAIDIKLVDFDVGRGILLYAEVYPENEVKVAFFARNYRATQTGSLSGSKLANLKIVIIWISKP